MSAGKEKLLDRVAGAVWHTIACKTTIDSSTSDESDALMGAGKRSRQAFEENSNIHNSTREWRLKLVCGPSDYLLLVTDCANVWYHHASGATLLNECQQFLRNMAKGTSFRR